MVITLSVIIVTINIILFFFSPSFLPHRYRYRNLLSKLIVSRGEINSAISVADGSFFRHYIFYEMIYIYIEIIWLHYIVPYTLTYTSRAYKTTARLASLTRCDDITRKTRGSNQKKERLLTRFTVYVLTNERAIMTTTPRRIKNCSRVFASRRQTLKAQILRSCFHVLTFS